MKYKLYTLMALGCMLFSSCSKDSLGLGTETVRTEAKTQVVKMSLGARFSTYEKEGLEESPEEEFRALERQNIQFEIRDGQNKFILNDNGGNTSNGSKRGHVDTEDLKAKAANIKFYVQVRKKNTTNIVGSLHRKWVYGTWNNDGTYVTDWRLNGIDIPLTGVNPATDELQVRVVAGGTLDTDNNKILIPKPEYQILDLSRDNKVSLPVPFVSDWMDLSYNAAKDQYTTVNDAKIRLKPLGILLVTTVRSSMKNSTSLTGIRYVSNALAFQGEYLLDGSDKVSFKPVGGRLFQTDVTEDNYYEVVYDFKEAITVTPGAKPNNKVIVSWALPTGKAKAVAWQTNNGGNPKNPSSINWQREDLSPMISMPQTHAYAEGVSNPGHTNFKVVPVMGTNHNFEPGKSAAINCELYDTPRQILGYFAHYTVNKEGTGFDTSHEPSQVSLVNWKVAKDFLNNGKELVGAGGQKATFKMGNEAMAVFTGNYFSTIWTADNVTTSYIRLLDPTDPTKGTVVARSYPVLINYGNDDNANIQEGTRSLMQVYIPSKNPRANYTIIGRELNAGEYKKRGRSRNRDQVVIKTESELGPQPDPANPGQFFIGTRTYTSVSLGKYFVGTAYSPIYNNKSAYDEDLWSDPVFLKGRVQRRMPAAGHYGHSAWDPGHPTEVRDVDDLQPYDTTRDNVGKTPIYWFKLTPYNYAGTGKLMKALGGNPNSTRNGAEWLEDTSIFQRGGGNVLYYPYNNGATLKMVERDARYMWQALWPIANKYQGDNIDPD